MIDGCCQEIDNIDPLTINGWYWCRCSRLCLCVSTKATEVHVLLLSVCTFGYFEKVHTLFVGLCRLSTKYVDVCVRRNVLATFWHVNMSLTRGYMGRRISENVANMSPTLTRQDISGEIQHVASWHFQLSPWLVWPCTRSIKSRT